MPTPQPSNNADAWLADGGALFDIGLRDDLTAKPVGVSTHIGPYRLIEKLGEGGLGVVWRAEQTEPMQREVAIKLTKPELHYRAEVITRFDLERQALARMQHPNIAAILDAGTLPDERPYFVMELVRGAPLTTYCTQHQLSVRARLELFIAICLAVQHAHQKGILHRDLKPSNILVTEHDGKPMPKIIDFGIAKALDDTDPALHGLFFKTQLGELPCATYQYMSPEQASRGVTDIDTRSDIYTLGVILYELLTGKLPLPDELAHSNSFDAIATHVRSVDPTLPSQRITHTGTKTNALRGDLDWIVLRALEKNRERRYESAAALAEDLQRHLAHKPVHAGPPSALYRCGKWVRRHRVAFASIAAVSLSLLIGLVSTLFALQREQQALAREAEQRAQADTHRMLAEQRAQEATRARDAEAKARQAAEASRTVADTARNRAEHLINDMLFDLRDQLAPIGKVSLLTQVAQSAQAYFDAVPVSDDNDAQQRNRAAMLQNRGSILLVKGEASEALKLFEQSLHLMQARAKAQPANVQCLHDLGLAYERLGSAQEALHNDDAATRAYEEMLRIFEHLHASASKDQGTWSQDYAVAFERLGDLARKHDQLSAAIEHYTRGQSILKALPATPITQRQLAVLAGKLGATDSAYALPHFHNELALWTALLTATPDDATLQASAAIAHGHIASASPVTDALPHAQAQSDIFAKLCVLDPFNRDWQRQHATALHQLGVALEGVSRFDEALRTQEQALELATKLPDSQREQAAAHLRLAMLLFRTKHETDAQQHAQQTLRLLEGRSNAEASAWRTTANELIQAITAK